MIPLTKAELRRRLRADLGKVPPDRLREAGESACARLRATPLWNTTRGVLAYIPIQQELDLRPALQEKIARGVAVALPRFDPASGDYIPAEVQRLEDLRPGPFRTLEPDPTAPACAWNRLDLALVPGLGFTADGRRLGRGLGYYDRLLASFRGASVGIALDLQVLGDLPVESHDVRLGNILTPTRWIQCEPRVSAE